MLRMIFACAVLAALAFGAQRGAAEAARATVRGAEAVNVRQQPTAESRALFALPRGAGVAVEEAAGDWSRVVLDDGRRGYIRTTYLEPADAATAPEPALIAAAAPPAGEAAPAVAPADATSTPPVVDRELERLRERLAVLEAALAATPHPTPTSLPIAGAPHAALPVAPINTVVAPPAALDVGPALALAGVGVIIGFLFGTFYGQRQERRRRSRVRF